MKFLYSSQNLPQGTSSRAWAREIFLMLMFALLWALYPVPCWAQPSNYPQHPIKLVVPFPPGGATDVIGRIVAQELSKSLNQQVLVENKSGDSGNLGAELVAKSPADGYTLLLGALTSHSINAVDGVRG